MNKYPTSHVDHPRPRQPRVAAAGNDGSIEETGEDPGVSADVFEDGDGVEGGLVVGLGGFEDGRVYSEGVGGAAAALNPNTRHGAIHLLDSIIWLKPMGCAVCDSRNAVHIYLFIYCFLDHIFIY